MNPPSGSSARVTVSVVADADDHPRAFLLTLGSESITLESGRTWSQIDRFKWATRGLIEPPQSFATHPDGSVDFNGDTFRPAESGHSDALAETINKHHAPQSSPRPKVSPRADRVAGPQRVQFRVHLDALGHLAIQAVRGSDHTETGVRGLNHLVADGWMAKPTQLHVDPLQRYVEIDGTRFACTADGAQDLESALNARYVPAPASESAVAVEIRENPGASTGFDIHFWTVRAGTRFEIKGHLAQDKLDILQDHSKCDLLQPGVILRLSPPFLYVRRRRADGGEESIPGIPDVKYRGVSAAELQRLLNHPSLRRLGNLAEAAAPDPAALPPDLASLRLYRRPEDRHHVWLELTRLDGPPLQRAFTHPNVAGLQQAGLFRPGFDIHLSLDHRELTIHSPATAEPQRFLLDPSAPDSVLAQASRLLSDALKEPVLAPSPSPVLPAETRPLPEPAAPPLPAPAPLPPELTTPQTTPPLPPPPSAREAPPAGPRSQPAAANPSPAAIPAEVAHLFAIEDPALVNAGCFRELATQLNLPVQDFLFSLPHVFEEREFEILGFDGTEPGSVFELRGADFFGFYLSHVRVGAPDLVYACRGTHLEWGHDKSVFQASLGAEPIEIHGHGLRGLAQDADHHFVFVVTDRYRDFIRPHEKACAEAFARFVTLAEWSAQRDDFALVWPKQT